MHQRVLFKRIPETLPRLVHENRCNVHSKNDANATPAIAPTAIQNINAITINPFSQHSPFNVVPNGENSIYIWNCSGKNSTPAELRRPAAF
jgi:hypothetical protein